MSGVPSTKTRKCSECEETKQLINFRHKKNYGKRCNECVELSPTFRQYDKGLDPEYRRRLRYKASHLKNTYGIELEDYFRLLAEQDGKCAICGADEPEGRFFSIDHDHRCCNGKTSCGKCVRGLLCMSCNSGLGCFKDSREGLLDAVRYLEGWTLNEDGEIIT